MSISRLNIFTTIDVSWLPYACMFIKSVKCFSSDDVALNYWIVHDDIPIDEQKIVYEWATSQSINLNFINFTNIISKNSIILELKLSEVYSFTRINVATFWGRYLGSFFLPKSDTRYLYADVDMIAVSPIAGLMEINLQGKSLGAVKYPISMTGSTYSGLNQYFNNGLIVFDVDRFDAVKYVQKMKNILNNHHDNKVHLTFGPQCAFNLASDNMIYCLDDCWNVQGELRSHEKNPKLIHFTGQYKPWHYQSEDKLRNLVKQYLMQTPYPEAWEPDYTLLKYLKNILKKLNM